jgi:nucleoside-diphosphate-sugar epimerase
MVTGCAGFIGSHLSESLLADGHSVLADGLRAEFEWVAARAHTRTAHVG